MAMLLCKKEIKKSYLLEVHTELFTSKDHKALGLLESILDKINEAGWERGQIDR